MTPASAAVRNIYDDEKITLEAKIAGTAEAVAKIASVDFMVTTTAEGTDTAKAPISAPVEAGSPATAKHEYTPDPVEGANDFYDLEYKAKITPPGRDPLLQPGAETFRIWPTKVELTFEAADNEAHKGAKFRWVQAGRKGQVERADDSGKWSERLDKIGFDIEMVAPWAFDGPVEHKGCKRSYKIKKNAYEFEFIDPAVTDATQKTKQYVNLDVDAAGWSAAKPFGRTLEFKVGGKGDRARVEAERLAQPDDIVHIEINFTPATKRNDPKPKLLDDGLEGSATASNSDKTWKGKAKLDADGQATFKVDLGYAGGDLCEVKIGYDPACGDAKLEFESWRRLFYELLYADVMVPALLDAGGGQHDLPTGVKTAADTRVGAAFVEYKLAAGHKYTEAQAHAGMIVDATWIGKAGRKQVLAGGRINGGDPVPFNAANDRTIHIKIADMCFSTNVSDNPQAPELDSSPFTWQSPQDYLVPCEVDVSGKTWEAVIATPDNYKARPSLAFTGSSNPADKSQPCVFHIRETTQNKTLDLTYARASGTPEATLSATEKAKIEPFIQGLLAVADLRAQNNSVELEIEAPDDAITQLGEVETELRASFDTHKPEVYTHPGLKDDGSVKSGNVDAAWFTAKSYDEVEITLPTNGDNSVPGDFVGTLSATKCPIKVEFTIAETYRINGNSGGGRQLFCYDSDRVDGALASTLCHELGHSMGMTIMSGESKIPPGTDAAKHVDNGGTYYLDGSAPFNNGIRDIGRGPHCGHGVPGGDLSNSTFNGKDGSCVMFHSGGDTDSRPSYCDTCKAYISARKLTDIRSSWTGRADADY